jgi:hypothetical protein
MKVEQKCTVTIDGDEADLYCRAWVIVEPFGATLDGRVEVLLPEGWFDLEDVAETADVRRVGEALCDLANEDDSSQCVEVDDAAE